MMTHAIAAALALIASAPTGASRVEGDYIEARTADIYTGPCFSNAEVFITGHQAVMAWNIRRGEWDGVDVSGLVVAAAVRGTTTLAMDDAKNAKAVIMVDDRATERQRKALESLARELGGERLAKAKDVKFAKMGMFVEAPMEHSAAHETNTGKHHGPVAPRGTFWAAGLAEINTRPLESTDHACGNEVVAYPPLSRGVSAQPAYTLANSFQGKGLNTQWDDRNCRGSFVGQFAY